VYTRLGEATLKTGEHMEIGCVECPDPVWAARIESLLGHKGPPWRYHVEAAVRQPLDDLQTLFYLGTIGGTAVSNVMIVGPRRGAGGAGVGILGHVYTAPEHRRKGAYSRLMAVQMEHTQRLGYRLLTLGTGFESPPYWIYHSFGFRSSDGTSGRMKWLVTPDAEARWFRPGAVTARPMRWEDWAALNLLALHPTGPDEELPRSWALRLPTGPGSVGSSFIELQLALASAPPHDGEPQPRPTALTFETEHGAAVGWAILQPDELTLRDGWRLDAYVHPAFSGQAARLLSATPWPEHARVTAYTGGPEGGRSAALRRAGFRLVAELPGWVRHGRAPAPLRVFAREPAGTRRAGEGTALAVFPPAPEPARDRATSRFQGPRGEPGHEVALEEQEQQQHGQAHHQRRGHQAAPVHLDVADVGVQEELRRAHPGRGGDDGGDDEVVPGVQEGQQGHGDQRRPGHGQHDEEQRLQARAAVDHGRLLQLAGHGAEEAPQDPHAGR
jgi:GNAT superfamily N-acetyltransferase